jgi:hypothetical protein
MKTTVTRWDVSKNDANTVYIGRPSRWGNPFKIGTHGSRQEVLDKYILWFIQPERAALRAAAVRELKGKKLACFCHPKPCHGHVLAYYVNEWEAIEKKETNLFTGVRFAHPA